MSYYLISSILNFLASLGVSVLVFVKNRKPPANRWFTVFAPSVAWWALGYALWQGSKDYDVALFWIRFAMAGSIVIPITFFEFVLRLLNQEASFKGLRLVNLVAAIILLLFSYSPLFVGGLASVMHFRFWPQPGPFFYGFHLFFVGNVIFAHLLMFLKWRSASPYLRRRIFFVLIATAIGFLGGMTNHFLWYGVQIPPFGNIGVSICVMVLAYAIIAHRLMDIEVIIKKTLVFAGLFGFVSATVSLVVFLLNTYLARFTGLGPTLSTGIAIVTAIFLYDPVKRLLIEATDRFLFQKKEDFRKTLNRLSERIITILDLDAVGKTILDTLKASLRAESGVILLRNETGYRTLNSFGIGWTQATRVYPPDEAFVQYLRDRPGLIDLEFEDTLRNLPPPVLKTLQALKAVLAIPLFLHGELIGILTLGKKLSDQEYLQDEIDYFPTVAGQAAIALSNARLYGEAVEAKKKIEAMQLELIHHQKMAFVSDLVKGIAHEVFNPLTPVFHAIDDLEKEAFVGLFNLFERTENHLPERERENFLHLLRGVRSSIQTLKVNSQHIHLVIETLNKMQKEDEQTIGPLDFKMFLKDSSALIGMELHSEGREIPVIEDIQRRLPPIKGNPTLLKQVFVNLFKNAIDAMDGIQEKKITIKADVDPANEHFLKIEFRDTGSGIPADILPRIFDFGFTTKGKKGQGIGLSQCKLIIEKFGGSMDCTSEVGSGTTFTIRLPLWEERHDRQNSHRG